MNLEGSHRSTERQHQMKGKIILLCIAAGGIAKVSGWGHSYSYPLPLAKKWPPLHAPHRGKSSSSGGGGETNYWYYIAH
jgi:hypothetical protein